MTDMNSAQVGHRAWQGKEIIYSRWKCNDLEQPDPVGKNYILESTSGKLHFSLYRLTEKLNCFISNVPGCPRIAALPSTLIARN